LAKCADSLKGFKSSRVQKFSFADLRFRVTELKSFKVSEFQTCPTDIYNAENEHDLRRSGGVSEFQVFHLLYIFWR
jgi:hypothetical protein